MAGKRIAGRSYFHVSLLDGLPIAQRQCIDEAIALSGLITGEHFHVVRLDLEQNEVALLSYPTFFEGLFPSLLASWRVHLPTRSSPLIYSYPIDSIVFISIFRL
jgi:hypothetical protein